MAIINFRVLDEYITEDSRAAFIEEATSMAQDQFSSAKEVFLEEFLTHPISQEIEEGAKVDGGSLPIGNLFSFIGFEAGETPIEDLYRFLEAEIQLDTKAKFSKTGKNFSFDVFIPSKDDIKDQTPMPWGTARSWVFAIESGIAGLNRYIFSQNRDLGRSGGGVQSRSKTGLASGYQAQRYLSDLLNRLKKNL